MTDRPDVPNTWIIHDDKRMHDPALSSECWRCLSVRIAELEAVVITLLRHGAPIEDRPNRGVWQCTLCDSDVSLFGADDPENHAADCVWAMARKLTKGRDSCTPSRTFDVPASATSPRGHERFQASGMPMPVDMSLQLDLVRRMTASQEARTGAMIALIPEAAAAERLAVPGFEDPDQLHVTLLYLGKAADWAQPERDEVLSLMRLIADRNGQIRANVWARANFNPESPESCAVYLVGGQMIADACRAVRSLSSLADWSGKVPVQHEPWVPHVTIGYDLELPRLSGADGGTVAFDRLRVAFAGEQADFPLR